MRSCARRLAFLSILLSISSYAFSQAAILSSVSPTVLSPGMQVTLTGSGFGPSQGSGRVGFNNLWVAVHPVLLNVSSARISIC